MVPMTAGWAGATSGPTRVQEHTMHGAPEPIRSEKIHDSYAKSSVSTQNGTAAGGIYLGVLSESILVVATDTTWEGSRSVVPDGRARMLDAAFAA